MYYNGSTMFRFIYMYGAFMDLTFDLWWYDCLKWFKFTSYEASRRSWMGSNGSNFFGCIRFDRVVKRCYLVTLSLSKCTLYTLYLVPFTLQICLDHENMSASWWAQRQPCRHRPAPSTLARCALCRSLLLSSLSLIAHMKWLLIIMSKRANLISGNWMCEVLTVQFVTALFVRTQLCFI
jgi:hypothetical protein